MAVYSTYSNIASTTTWTEAYAAIVDGNTVGWYLADDLTTITKVANLISAWNDKLGSGHNLLQSNAAFKPLWVTPETVRFDGTTDVMNAAFNWDQPCCVYILFKQIAWTNLHRIFDGNAQNFGALWQYSVTPNIIANAGVLSAENSNLILDTWSIVRVLFNGASSQLQVNATAITAGNFGTRNMDGFTLGGCGGGVPDFNTRIDVKEVILRSNVTNITAAKETAIYNYLVTRKP
jgi:hypothetical protein